MRARSPENFMDVCDVKMTGEDGFPSYGMMFKAKHYQEGTYLDQSCGQRNCVSASHPETDMPGSTVVTCSCVSWTNFTHFLHEGGRGS